MATIVQFPSKDPEQEATDFLYNMPAKYAACHGFGHAFPKPGKKSKGFKLIREADGWQQLRMTCRDCGMVRSITAAPGEVIELPAKRYTYDGPAGYYAPKGTGPYLSRRRYANETTRRWREEIAHPTGGEDMTDVNSR